MIKEKTHIMIHIGENNQIKEIFLSMRGGNN